MVAGAGSGKTEVLVRHFCHIIERRRARIDEILTVTFTEKAAGEMQDRIVQGLEETGCHEAAAEIDAAFIGTIHGVCRRLLRENPVDALIDPGFAVISDIEARLLAGQVFDKEFPASGIESLDRGQTRWVALSLQGRLHGLGRPISRDVAFPPSNPLLYLGNLRRSADHLLLQLDEKQGEKLRVIEIVECANLLVSGTSSGHVDWKLVDRLRAIEQSWASSVHSDCSDWLDSLRKAVAEVVASCLDAESDRFSESMLKLVGDLDDAYAAEKRSHGLMDYDDLLLAADRLLLTPECKRTPAAERYRERFRFVILDEFQDTNRLQKRIIDAISRPNNVFTVGDAKQSIFSFAQADVEVFHEHQRKAKRSGAKFFPLDQNFRSRPGILRFVNEFFTDLWNEDSDSEYRPVLCASKFQEKSIPDVEILSVEAGAAAHRREAEAIAQRVLEITGLTGGPPLALTRSGQEGVPVRFGDILILLRSTANLGTYETALRSRGIDVHSISGRGFYSSPEISVLISILRAAEDPLNNQALHQALRSGFVGISSEGLAILAGYPGRLWDLLVRMDHLTEIDHQDRFRLVTCRRMLQDVIEVGLFSGIQEALDAIVHRYGLLDYLSSLSEADQRCANVRKFQEIAQRFQQRALPGNHSFLRYVQGLQRSGESEAELIEDGRNAVRIMTVHKAKGLQAPVVFIADMSRSMDRPSGRVAIESDFGLAMELRHPRTGRVEKPMSFSLVSERLNRRDIAEEKRLLYVAMTRAEEHLILSGSSSFKGESGVPYSEIRSWMGWLEKAFGFGPESDSSVVQLGTSLAMLRRDPVIQRVFPEEPLSPKVSVSCIQVPEESDSSGFQSEISVSGILDYIDCPAKFRYCHLMGVPPGGRWRLDEDSESSAAALGTRVHGILENTDFRSDPPTEILRDLDDEARSPVERFYESRWFEELHSADRIIKEQFFRVRVGGVPVIGRMDVVYHGAAGWTILDYKTGRGEDRERYELQVGIYSLACKQLFGSLPSRAVLLLLSMDEEWVVDTLDGRCADMALEKIRQSYSSISSNQFAPTHGKSCTHCSYSAICKVQLEGVGGSEAEEISSRRYMY